MTGSGHLQQALSIAVAGISLLAYSCSLEWWGCWKDLSKHLLTQLRKSLEKRELSFF
jgi:hypothetical protein